MAFFLLEDPEGFRQALLRALPRGRLRGRGADLVEDINTTMAACMRAAMRGSKITVICTIGFIVIGVRTGWLSRVLRLLESFPWSSLPLVVALGTTLIAGFHSLNQAVMVLLFLGVLRVAQDYVNLPASRAPRDPDASAGGDSSDSLRGRAGRDHRDLLAIPLVAVLSVSYRHWLEYRGSEGLVADLLQPAEAAAVAVPSRASLARRCTTEPGADARLALSNAGRPHDRHDRRLPQNV